MESILYILIGLLYAEALMATISISIFSTYIIIRFAFWVFEILDIPNPMILLFKIIQDIIDL